MKNMKISIIFLTLLCNTLLADAEKNNVVSESDFQNRKDLLQIDTNNLNNLRVRQFNLEIIPPSSGVQFYRKGIIFLSHSTKEEKVPEHHLSFGSIRLYESLFEDTIPGKLIPFDLISPELFPSEATSFSSDFKTMYLSLIPEKSGNEKIFKAEQTSSGWEIEDKPLDICNDNYIYSHPCLSEDGSFLVFSSNVAGSQGGLDLWVTRKEGERWGSPKSLGKQINSAGNELFASLDRWNNLYFSSDGHSGKGGYDIYIARYNGSGWDRPIDLPGIINTLDDELAFTIDKEDNKTAFFTSRSRSGRYRTQLFIVDINNEPSQNNKLTLSESFLATANGENRTEPLNTANEPQGKIEVEPSAAIAQTNMIQQAQKEEPSSSIPVQTAQSAETKKEPDVSSRPQTDSDATKNKAASTPAGTPSSAVSTVQVTNDEVVYRVQITASTKSVGSMNVAMAGKNYKSFEYLYQGAYRTTIGEFKTLPEAMKLQSVCRQNGYSQAFVVAFKNNIRSNDPELFKKIP